MSNEPKVTECWALADGGLPDLDFAYLKKYGDGYRPAVILWREDYDAMRKELEELRAHRTISLEKMGWSKEQTTEAHDDEEAK